jgi:Mg2+ and Co2+ transporter CorA
MPDDHFESQLNLLRTINNEMDAIQQDLLKTIQKIVSDLENSRKSLIEACNGLISNELEKEE